MCAHMLTRMHAYAICINIHRNTYGYDTPLYIHTNMKNHIYINKHATCKYTHTVMSLKESKEGYIGELGGRKGKAEMILITL